MQIGSWLPQPAPTGVEGRRRKRSHAEGGNNNMQTTEADVTAKATATTMATKESLSFLPGDELASFFPLKPIAYTRDTCGSPALTISQKRSAPGKRAYLPPSQISFPEEGGGRERAETTKTATSIPKRSNQMKVQEEEGETFSRPKKHANSLSLSLFLSLSLSLSLSL